MKKLLCVMLIPFMLCFMFVGCKTQTETPEETVIVTVEFVADGWERHVFLDVPKGTSVQEATDSALEALEVEYEVSKFGDFVYYSSINGYKEKTEGAYSGWVYEVDDEEVLVGAGLYIIEEECVVTWEYITSE